MVGSVLSRLSALSGMYCLPLLSVLPQFARFVGVLVKSGWNTNISAVNRGDSPTNYRQLSLTDRPSLKLTGLLSTDTRIALPNPSATPINR